MIIDGEEYVIRLGGKAYHCALDITMDYIGGKWKTVVLWYLRREARRFGELKRHIPEITEKMLSIQLKALVRDGLVERKAYAEVPPRVEYRLSREGRTLLPVLEELAAWGRRKGAAEGKMVGASS